MSDLDDDELGVDLTPLIDVIFMLVIFFIMTMTFSLPSIELELPDSETALRQPRAEGVLQIAADADGIFYYQLEPVDYDALKQLLQDGDYHLIELTIDRSAPAQTIIDAVDLARTYTGGQLQISAAVK